MTEQPTYHLTRTLAILALLAGSAQAAPPPAGSPDSVIMHEFSGWIEAQYSAYGLCCSVADARPMGPDEIRLTNGVYQVLYSRTHWDEAPDPGVWLDIPHDAFLPGVSPVGMPIVWVYHGSVRCAIMAGAV